LYYPKEESIHQFCILVSLGSSPRLALPSPIFTPRTTIRTMTSSLPKIALGSQGLQVSKLGFGCMGLTTAYGSKLPDDEIVSMLEKVYEQGVNFWDTANLYVFLEPSRLLRLQSPLVCQEEIIQKALHSVGRDNIVIATKTGVSLSVFPKITITGNGDPAFIRKQCEASLKRLRVDCLDLLYLHRIDQTTPIEKSMLEMKKLVEEGKVKYVGLSECSAATLRRAHKIHPISCIQMEYSLWCRGIEKDVLPTCKELRVGLVAYSPLGRGFFGGAHKEELANGDFRVNQARFQHDANHKMYEKVEEIARAKNATPAQLALAWVEAQQDRAAGVVAIPGTTKEKNLSSNVASVKIELSKEDLAALEAAVPDESEQPARYDNAEGKTWDTDKNPALTREESKELGLEQ
jgi:aryl-alcohol dehydrogenase-like predicted oxidoreductase